MNRLLLAGRLAFVVMLAQVAAASAQDDHPDLDLTLRVEASTGSFTAETLIEAPRGTVVLPVAEWLSIDRVSVLDGAGPIALPTSRLSIAQEVHRSRDLRVSVSGRLPEPARQLAPIGWTPDATYMVGPSVFPVDTTTIRDHRVTIDLPSDQVVAATGRLLSDRVAGDRREAQFRFIGRSDDLGLFAGRYTVAEATHGTGVLRTYFDTADTALSDRYFDALSRYLDRYEAEVGPYPYDGFSVVAAPIPVGLGFAGLTYVGRDILGHPYMTGRSLAHEVLHSWWGNAVGVDYATGNWAEGLTTFQADYALAEDSGAAAARDMRVGWIRDLAALPTDAMQPLTAFRAASHAADQSEGYGKAAFVFHMLRDEVGPDVFSDGIRAFYDRNRDRIAGWSDIAAAFEGAAERDLGWFFEQWVQRAGLPRVTLAAADLADGPEGTVATLVVRQHLPSYRLRLPVVFDMPSGPPVRHTVEIDGAETRIEIDLPGRPVTVRMDPDFDIARAPLERELAPILRSVRSVGPLRAVAATPLGEASVPLARALSGLTGAADLSVQRALPPIGTEGTTLILGQTGDVLARRPAHLGPLPDDARRGTTRLWVERDRGGGLWLFLSYDDPDTVLSDLGALRFYTGQSYVTFSQGRAVSAGVWPVADHAGTLRFDIAGQAGGAP